MSRLAILLLAGLATGCANKAVSTPTKPLAQATTPEKAGTAGFIQKTGATISGGVQSSVKMVSATFTPKPKEPVVGDPVALDTKTKPAGPDLYLSAAALYENQGNFPAAAAEYEKALKLAPNDLASLLCYAHLYDRQGKLPEATKLYKQAVAAHPKDAGARNDLGLCYARRSMLEEASAELTKAVELQPDRKLYRNNLATVKVEQGRIDEALKHFSAVNPPAVAHYNVGYLLVQKGNRRGAAEQFSHALNADPTLVNAAKWLAKLNGDQTAAAPGGSSRRDVAPVTPLPSTPAVVGTAPSEQRLVDAPVPGPTPQYLQPRAASTFQVRHPQSAGEARGTDEGGVPPTPENVEYSAQRTNQASNPDALRLLPPVNSAYFAPSRY